MPASVKKQRGGSQASASVEAAMSPAAYARLDAMFTNELPQQQGGARKKAAKPAAKKKPVAPSAPKPAARKNARQCGGSLASDAVEQNVPAGGYQAMDSVLTGMSGGGAAAKKTKARAKASTAGASKPKAQPKPKSGRANKASQRGGSLSSDAVLSNMSNAAFAEMDARMGGVLPPAAPDAIPTFAPTQSGGAARRGGVCRDSVLQSMKKAASDVVQTVKKSLSSVAKKGAAAKADAAKKQKKPAAAAKKAAKKPTKATTGGKKKKSTAKQQRGGSSDGSCMSDSASPSEDSYSLFTTDTKNVPVAAPAESDTRFSSCEYNDVLMAPGAVLGPRFDYTMLPEYNGTPFTLPIPPEWQYLSDALHSAM